MTELEANKRGPITFLVVAIEVKRMRLIHLSIQNVHMLLV
jgi:hypothetical protein